MAKYIHVVLKMPPSATQLLIFAKQVLAAMNENPRFPNPTPSLNVLDARSQDLDKALSGGTSTECAAAKEALRECLKHLGDYVQLVAETAASTADIDAIQALIESGGFSLRRLSPRAKLAFGAKRGPDAGSVDLTAPAGRDPHDWAYSTDQQTWITLPSTRQATTRVTGLSAGVSHYFRHRLLTRKGYSSWSEPVMIVPK